MNRILLGFNELFKDTTPFEAVVGTLMIVLVVAMSLTGTASGISLIVWGCLGILDQPMLLGMDRPGLFDAFVDFGAVSLGFGILLALAILIINVFD